MKVSFIPFAEINALSSRDKAYVASDERLAPFYKYPVDIEGISKAIQDKSTNNKQRGLLTESLLEQYQNVVTTDVVMRNIKSLSDSKTFTVTTAHQPSLATGPLYFIYKIISVLNLAEQLIEKYPEYHFVPIFFLGSEDHDFEEINHFHLFGKTYEWQSNEKGSTGAMSTQHLQAVLEAVQPVLGDSDNAKHVFDLLSNAYTKHATYNEATLYLVNQLFAAYGLVVLLPNTSKLKSQFVEVMRDDLLNHSSYQLVNDQITALKAQGFKGQASPRKTNLFYLEKGARNRIEAIDGHYNIVNTDKSFTEREIITELEQHPERFSPNVILRPLYQETILPNLAYVGGGGELAYWMERLTQFNHYKINFPMLIRRNSVLWLDKGALKKMKKLNLSTTSIFDTSDQLITSFVNEQTKSKIDLTEEKAIFAKQFDLILEKATLVDPGLKNTVLGEQTKQNKGLEQLEAKLLRAEKRKFEESTNQIKGLKKKLFPNDGLQERKDNFIGYYLKYGEEFIPTLKKYLDPFNKEFIIITDEN